MLYSTDGAIPHLPGGSCLSSHRKPVRSLVGSVLRVAACVGTAHAERWAERGRRAAESLADILSLPVFPGRCTVVVESLERFDLLYTVCCCPYRGKLLRFFFCGNPRVNCPL